MDWIKLISAGGIGAIVATIIKSWLEGRAAMKEKTFQEKKNAYVGFLKSIHDSEVKRTEEAALYAGHWIDICDLVGSRNVQNALQAYMRTNPVNGVAHPERAQVMKKLKDAMRQDLGFPID
jgi:K+ transporter